MVIGVHCIHCIGALYRSFGRVIGDWDGLEYWDYDFV